MNTLDGLRNANQSYYKVGSEEVRLNDADKAYGLVFGGYRSPSVLKERQRQKAEKFKRYMGLGD